MQYALNHCSRTVTENSVTFTGPCVVTGHTQSITVPKEGFQRYQLGALIQDVFPHLPVNDREFLISGMSSEGWAKTFADEEDEDEGEQQESGGWHGVWEDVSFDNHQPTEPE